MDNVIWVPVIIVLIVACFSLGSKGALHNTSYLKIVLVIFMVIAAACIMTWGIE
ncbi:hypothetical protein VLF36_004574 [Salmonella enterica]|nr:hypothetical protein [Salmonella enterica]